MSFKSWLIYRAILRRLKTILKEGKTMKPLPKWFGLLSGLVAALPGLYAAYESGGVKGLLLALMGILGGGGAVLSHSLTGTGGK